MQVLVQVFMLNLYKLSNISAKIYTSLKRMKACIKNAGCGPIAACILTHKPKITAL